MMRDSEMLFAVVQFDNPSRRTVLRVVAPFPDRSAAATFALDNDLRYFTVGPMVFAVPTNVPDGVMAPPPTTPGPSPALPYRPGTSADGSAIRGLPTPRPSTT